MERGGIIESETIGVLTPPLIRIAEHLWLRYDPNGCEVLMEREEYDRIQLSRAKENVMQHIRDNRTIGAE